jgi:predicted DCC family thiol-disulfide oxidoreductase YuxK
MIYDGRCPLCASGARFAKGDEGHGRLKCVDARGNEVVRRVYPLFPGARNLLLKLLGRQQINV